MKKVSKKVSKKVIARKAKIFKLKSKTKSKTKKQVTRKQKKTKSKSKSKSKSNKQDSRNVKLEIEELTQRQPKKIIMYSKNSKTGKETVFEVEKMEKDGMKSIMVKSESIIPPTIIVKQNGPNKMSSSLSMSQKRQMVVQSYSSK
jgi:hypothetical protein